MSSCSSISCGGGYTFDCGRNTITVRPSFSDGCSKGSSQRGVLCGNIRFLPPKTECFMLPKEISLEKETVKFRVWKNGKKQDDINLSFKEIKKYQRGEYDINNKKYFVCGIRVDKDGNLKFTKNGKDYIKGFLEGGYKAWEKFKDLREETKKELKALNEQEEEEDYDR
jgi:hypothetical protein